MAEILLTIIAWCKADPYPYKTVAQCRQQLIQCVKGSRGDLVKCFEQPEDLKWPSWEKVR
jgi:hypothetical protein